jgi:DNA adenine methylase
VSAIRTSVGRSAVVVEGVAPFLKWTGGKRWLASAIAPLFAEHLERRYIEPFLGSGAMFLAFGPKQALLSDINGELIAALRTIATEPEAVVRTVWRYSNSADCYYKVRSASPRTEVGAAARFLYLNRTAWGGVHRLNRQGQFNTPFGNSGRVICRLETVLKAAQSFATARLRDGDFEQAMNEAGCGDVIYADPPYVSETSGHGTFRRYAKESFYWEDQLRLADAADRAAGRGARVAVSARAGQGIERLYPGWSVLQVQRCCRVSRKLGGRGQFDEVVLLSPGFQKMARLGDVA